MQLTDSGFHEAVRKKHVGPGTCIGFLTGVQDGPRGSWIHSSLTGSQHRNPKVTSGTELASPIHQPKRPKQFFSGKELDDLKPAINSESLGRRKKSEKKLVSTIGSCQEAGPHLFSGAFAVSFREERSPFWTKRLV